MTRTLAIVGILACLAAGFAYWRMCQDAKLYEEADAFWRIRGVCTNALDGAPIKGGQVEAFFEEPFTSKLHWQKPRPPLRKTKVVATTDDEGRFIVAGQGGFVFLRVSAEGYRDQHPWECWHQFNRGRVRHVDTTIAVTLMPVENPVTVE
jgi:hypothetical protein